MSDSDMKQEYDFSNGVRGKFYKPGAALRLPVYLDEGLQAYLAAAAERKDTSLTGSVNYLLSKQVAIAEAIK
jgi:hypothetical protein